MDKTEQIKKRYSEEDFKKIIQTAASLYHKPGYDHDILTETAAELDIPPEYLRQAIINLEQEKKIKAGKKKSQLYLLIILGGILVIMLAVVIRNYLQANPGLASIRRQHYNKIVEREENVRAGWAQVENVMERRFQLLPDLLAITREYADFEKTIIDSLRTAQEQFAAAASIRDKMDALQLYNRQLTLFMQQGELIAGLKSAALYQNLLFEIAGSENRISVERKRYNNAVSAYNSYARQYPLSEYLTRLGFDKEKEYYQAAEPALQNFRVE